MKRTTVFIVSIFILIGLGCNFPYQISATQEVIEKVIEVAGTPEKTLAPTRGVTPTATVTPIVRDTEIPISSPTLTPTKVTSYVVRMVSVPGVFDFSVVQQPNDQSWVSLKNGEVTEHLKSHYIPNVILLAHNHLAGREFFKINLGDFVYVYFENRSESFRITKIYRYQSIEPVTGDYVFTDLIDLETGKEYPWEDVEILAYAGDYHLTFQTCIEKDRNPTWGLIFIIGEPVR